ncbi:MauE/DoxX family redox-associated membrane protein [Paenibacillus xylaniclasticus]|uniref:MauE/DoxX family redox-associated membrane protein n=1 Tax=Paenibacillus xylaniclasticus TaxID=588083 RepID=UPI000FDABEA4|nr:MauE/DoxX family redox-associated membrane protein [Paenibacillus xylaniclasticus]
MLISVFIKVLIGLVFSLSSYSKIKSSNEIENDLRLILPAPLLKVGVLLVIGVEMVIASSYLLDFFYYWREVATIFLLLFFILFIFFKKRVTGTAECTCFGHGNPLNKFPIYRNSILILLTGTNLAINYKVTIEAGILLFLSAVVTFLAMNIREAVIAFKTVRKIHDHL